MPHQPQSHNPKKSSFLAFVSSVPLLFAFRISGSSQISFSFLPPNLCFVQFSTENVTMTCILKSNRDLRHLKEWKQRNSARFITFSFSSYHREQSLKDAVFLLSNYLSVFRFPASPSSSSSLYNPVLIWLWGFLCLFNSSTRIYLIAHFAFYLTLLFPVTLLAYQIGITYLFTSNYIPYHWESSLEKLLLVSWFTPFAVPLWVCSFAFPWRKSSP